jgi:hypothetical protein
MRGASHRVVLMPHPVHEEPSPNRVNEALEPARQARASGRVALVRRAFAPDNAHRCPLWMWRVEVPMVGP